MRVIQVLLNKERDSKNWIFQKLIRRIGWLRRHSERRKNWAERLRIIKFLLPSSFEAEPLVTEI